MVQFHLLPSPPPGHDPQDLAFFLFLAVYSPPPGKQQETIPHPRDSLVTHCTQTQKRNNATFYVQNQNIIFISTQNHTIYKNQPETLSLSLLSKHIKLYNEKKT